ncbi:HNH endonuclease signature motif containing protein [Schaalia sp. JY-X159]|uniref:HNH endonuclease signature motif containing protein n=1 Tax=Schaalia sp. JY-X159 TaxID=2758575 RepID=UPI00165DC644|nr:HNH endonuclease signature motif containing protein [Schaalia sp. JY-X159]
MTSPIEGIVEGRAIPAASFSAGPAADVPAGLVGVITDLAAVGAGLPAITDIMGAPNSQVLELAQITAVLVKRLQAIGTGCAGVLDQRLKSGALHGGAMAGFTGGAALVRDLTGCSITEARARLRLAEATLPQTYPSTDPGSCNDLASNAAGSGRGPEVGSDPGSGSGGVPGRGATFELVASALETGGLSEAGALRIVDTLTQHDKRGGTHTGDMEGQLVGTALGLPGDKRNYHDVAQHLHNNNVPTRNTPTTTGTDTDAATGAGTDTGLGAGFGGTPTTGFSGAHLDEIRRACSQAADLWDPRQSIQADYHTTSKRFLTIGQEAHGLIPLRANLTPEIAAHLETMLNTITSPRTRHHWDPTNSDNTSSAGNHSSNSGDPAHNNSGDPASNSNDNAGGVWDQRSPAQKRHDAFASIITVASSAATHTTNLIKTGQPGTPLLGGSGTVVMMQTSRQALQNRRPGLIHTNQGPLTISNLAIEHAACTGAIQFYATDPQGKITELGNTQRVFTNHQKRVILARDGGCIIPGCDTPAQWCEVHHVTPHAQGGKTHTDNGVLLCHGHHRHIEHGPWNIQMKNGTPQIKPPHWKDPTQKWQPTTRVLPPQNKPPNQTSAPPDRHSAAPDETGPPPNQHSREPGQQGAPPGSQNGTPPTLWNHAA